SGTTTLCNITMHMDIAIETSSKRTDKVAHTKTDKVAHTLPIAVIKIVSKNISNDNSGTKYSNLLRYFESPGKTNYNLMFLIIIIAYFMQTVYTTSVMTETRKACQSLIFFSTNIFFLQFLTQLWME
ncbi:hypothetical protein ACJX0J_017419, partial [Zea mays]